MERNRFYLVLIIVVILSMGVGVGIGSAIWNDWQVEVPK